MNGLIAAALRQRTLVALLFLAMTGVGSYCLWALNIEAYPDPVPPLVDIVTQSTGQSAEEIERNITIPIEVQMAGIPHVTAIRTISLFGLSDVKLQFTYDFTYEEAEQRVINRLSQLGQLPSNAQPGISPWSPIGEIFRYRIVGPPGFSITELKTLQDWVLKRRFKAIPGVIDVNGWGGMIKTYDITVDLNRLVRSGITLPQMLQTLNNSSINVGGQAVNIGPQSAVVRGIGLVKSMDDIRATMLSSVNGSPVLVSDVAEVTPGHQPRLGIAGQDGDSDIVQGIVLMRRGEQSKPTIQRVEAEVEKINRGNILPPGVHIERIYDRLDLIGTTTHTVMHNVLMGILLIFLVQWVFLADLRSALIVACTIPFALFFAVIVMTIRGDSANLLSVGAIDFGLIVDASVIMIENVFRHLAEAHRGWAPEHDTADREGLSGKLGSIFLAGRDVARSIFFSAAIIIAGFVPLFTLSGIEGHIFAPMAKTYAYALAGGLLATFTVSPAFAALFMPDQVREQETFIVRLLRNIYRPAVELALRNRLAVMGGAAALLVAAVIAARTLGLEFLPKLEEGNLWIRAAMPPSISLEEGNGYVNRMRAIVAGFPEVETVVSQHGRPDDGTDAAGFANAEFFAPLKPQSEWPAGVDKDKLTESVKSALEAQFPGVEFNFSQYIEDNVAEAASGVKGENSVKLYGQDLAVLERTAQKIKDALASVSGIDDLAVMSSLGQPAIAINVDRARAARYGLAPGDVNSVVQAAIGGQSAGDLYEEGSDRHFPMVVRLEKRYRQSLDTIRNIGVGVSGGNGLMYVPLSELADIKLTSGAFYIYRENQERYLPIKFSVRGRDLGGAVKEAQEKVESEVPLPGGYHLDWAGEFGNLEEALARLEIVVPAGIAVICLLLYLNFNSVADMLLAASVIPMALIGGVFALALTGTPFSVSAAIGFVALFGIAAMDGIIVISYYNGRIQAGMSHADAIRRTCMTQMRPVLMTCIAAGAGLFPAALSSGIGSQVQKPLALVVVGGMILAPALILIILPVALDLIAGRRHVAGSGVTAPAE
jgi:cobalt-zinc-cadmium resistance protein CzcA